MIGREKQANIRLKHINSKLPRVLLRIKNVFYAASSINSKGEIFGLSFRPLFPKERKRKGATEPLVLSWAKHQLKELASFPPDVKFVTCAWGNLFALLPFRSIEELKSLEGVEIFEPELLALILLHIREVKKNERSHME